jgi:ABC-type uncharacterized transport system permease subunit
MTEALIVSILAITIRAGTSLLYATLGEIYTERSGILNLGVEGIMLVGAATAFAVAFHSGSAWVGLGAAMAVGGLLSLIHASAWPPSWDSGLDPAAPRWSVCKARVSSASPYRD